MNKDALIVELQAKNRALEEELRRVVLDTDEPALPRMGTVSTVDFVGASNKLLRRRAEKLTRHLNRVVEEMEDVQAALKLSSEMLLVATETALHESDRAKENDADS